MNEKQACLAVNNPTRRFVRCYILLILLSALAFGCVPLATVVIFPAAYGVSEILRVDERYVNVPRLDDKEAVRRYLGLGEKEVFNANR